ncbi:hypothetical protein C9F11_45615 (plasmid) [Streptomyces sp. YIM 121038]|uniref:hypothetical protein n=1 Tax=Streptomyces sp. YIM 121038 TaxID=2136401 RepID=UPI0011101D42|nr:hypothetical protein [Streptomyces sp. YIM 121038]QCX82681.1 hypothetical protein C9F11_45615 [Streptomyces sp. YIM 121038]
MPGITSGLAYGLAGQPVYALDEFCRLIQIPVGFALWGSKSRTAQAVLRFLRQAANAWLAITQRAAADVDLASVDHYAFFGPVPPHAASPCGILRLAVPIVPGAPSSRPSPSQKALAIAA